MWFPVKGKGKDNRKKIDPSRTIWVGNIPEGTQFQAGDLENLWEFGEEMPFYIVTHIL